MIPLFAIGSGWSSLIVRRNIVYNPVSQRQLTATQHGSGDGISRIHHVLSHRHQIVHCSAPLTPFRPIIGSLRFSDMYQPVGNRVLINFNFDPRFFIVPISRCLPLFADELTFWWYKISRIINISSLKYLLL